jgi:hypothetical protein
MNCTLLSFPFLPHFSLYHSMDKKLTFTHMYVCTYVRTNTNSHFLYNSRLIRGWRGVVSNRGGGTPSTTSCIVQL